MSEFGVELMTVFLSFICLALRNKVPEKIKKLTWTCSNMILRKTTSKNLVSQIFFKKKWLLLILLVCYFFWIVANVTISIIAFIIFLFMVFIIVNITTMFLLLSLLLLLLIYFLMLNFLPFNLIYLKFFQPRGTIMKIKYFCFFWVIPAICSL